MVWNIANLGGGFGWPVTRSAKVKNIITGHIRHYKPAFLAILEVKKRFRYPRKPQEPQNNTRYPHQPLALINNNSNKRSDLLGRLIALNNFLLDHTASYTYHAINEIWEIASECAGANIRADDFWINCLNSFIKPGIDRFKKSANLKNSNNNTKFSLHGTQNNKRLSGKDFVLLKLCAALEDQHVIESLELQNLINLAIELRSLEVEDWEEDNDEGNGTEEASANEEVSEDEVSKGEEVSDDQVSEAQAKRVVRESFLQGVVNVAYKLLEATIARIISDPSINGSSQLHFNKRFEAAKMDCAAILSYCHKARCRQYKEKYNRYLKECEAANGLGNRIPGFAELKEIADRLIELNYATWPPAQVLEQGNGDSFSTKDESYGVFYNREIFEERNKDQPVGEFAKCFHGRAPLIMHLALKEGGKAIDFIVWHAPSSTKGNLNRRNNDFRSLRELLKAYHPSPESSSPPVPAAVLLADLNIDTQNRSSPIQHCDIKEECGKYVNSLCAESTRSAGFNPADLGRTTYSISRISRKGNKFSFHKSSFDKVMILASGECGLTQLKQRVVSIAARIRKASILDQSNEATRVDSTADSSTEASSSQAHEEDEDEWLRESRAIDIIRGLRAVSDHDPVLGEFEVAMSNSTSTPERSTLHIQLQSFTSWNGEDVTDPCVLCLIYSSPALQQEDADRLRASPNNDITAWHGHVAAKSKWILENMENYFKVTIGSVNECFQQKAWVSEEMNKVYENLVSAVALHDQDRANDSSLADEDNELFPAQDISDLADQSVTKDYATTDDDEEDSVGGGSASSADNSIVLDGSSGIDDSIILDDPRVLDGSSGVDDSSALDDSIVLDDPRVLDGSSGADDSSALDDSSELRPDGD